VGRYRNLRANSIVASSRIGSRMREPERPAWVFFIVGEAREGEASGREDRESDVFRGFE
jgi:hypothetical protein